MAEETRSYELMIVIEAIREYLADNGLLPGDET